MVYKINIHAHTIFSDGVNTPYVMALEAKRLGFTSLVITDHYFGKGDSYNLGKRSRVLLRKACAEARDILPVIAGIELAWGNEEILTFGSAFIKEIQIKRDAGLDISLNEMIDLKHKNGGAMVLCHPGEHENWVKLHPLLDGFEHFNSGQDWFKSRDFGVLTNLPSWSNSDAHNSGCLERGFNLVDSKITDEAGLIRYIKRGKQPAHVVRGETRHV